MEKKKNLKKIKKEHTGDLKKKEKEKERGLEKFL